MRSKLSLYWVSLTSAEKTALATKTGLSRGHLSNIFNGTANAGISACFSIEKATYGDITKSDLRPEYF